MPGSKKTRVSTSGKTKSGRKPATKSATQGKKASRPSAQDQLRSFENRFNPESKTQIRENSPGINEAKTDGLLNALATAKPPVLIEETSIIQEDIKNDKKDALPPFLSDQYFYYAENRPVGSSIARISLDREVEIESYTFTNTGITISDDGYYQFDDKGIISLTLLGVLSQANDYKEGSNCIQHNIKLIDTKGNVCTAYVIFNIVDENHKFSKQKSSSGKSRDQNEKNRDKDVVSGNLLRSKKASKARKPKKTKGKHFLEFPLYELSRDKNRTRDESLILGLEQDSEKRIDRLIIVSEIRDRSLSVSLLINQLVKSSETSGNFIISRIDGGSLPGWLRVNRKEYRINGIVPAGLEKISIRIEFIHVSKVSIVRFITIDLKNGIVQELQSLESGNTAGVSLFTEQLETYEGAAGQDALTLFNVLNN